MFNIVLLEPEIPANTGNIIRACANTGCRLHLIAPLGFKMDDARLRRAGLDYHEYADVSIHEGFGHFRRRLPEARLRAFSTRGQRRYDEVDYRAGDVLLFGCETRGLPQELLDGIAAEDTVYIPQRPHSRSLNLSNAVAIAMYEAWRQSVYSGADSPRVSQ